MDSATCNANLLEDRYYADLVDIFDGDDCEDPLFTFDLFESSDLDRACAYERPPSFTFAKRLSITSVIPEDFVYEEATRCPKRRKSEQRNDLEQSFSSRPTNEKVLTRDMWRKKTVSSPDILSLLTSKQIKRQLEHTEHCLVESIERSAISRKRLHDQLGLGLDQEYCPSQAFNCQLSYLADDLVPSSSQSRTYIERSDAAYRLVDSIERSAISRKRLHDQLGLGLDQEYCPSQAFTDQLSYLADYSVPSSHQSRTYFERSDSVLVTSQS